MSLKTSLTNYTFSDLEKVLKEITTLQKENLSLMLDLEHTRAKIEQAKYLAQIEHKVYSGIKKLFK